MNYRIRQPGINQPRGFTDPSSAPGCVLWLEAYGITGVSDGADFQTWPAFVGNSTSQSNSALRPFFRTGQINGFPAVDFDYKRLDITVSEAKAQLFYVIKSKQSTWGGYAGAFERKSGTNRLGNVFESGERYFHNNPFPSSVRKNGSALSSPFDPTTIDSWMLLTVETANPSGCTSLHIGGLDDYHNGYFYLAGLAVYSSVLSSTNRDLVENWYRQKYALY